MNRVHPPSVPNRNDESTAILEELTRVPRPRPGVCAICHTWVPDGDTICENCKEVATVIAGEPLAASFVTLYTKPSPLRDWLTRYKGRPGGADPFDPAASRVVHEILRDFVEQHWSTVRTAVGGFDAVVVVPSTDRPAPHPLEALLGQIDLGVPVQGLLKRTGEPVGFRRPNPGAYELAQEAAGSRIFLLDDVYTTGAHLNSAAEAIRVGGGQVAGALVLARRINPDYCESARTLWSEARSRPFTWADGPYLAGVAS